MPTSAGIVESVPADLLDKLTWLTRFGNPRLAWMDDGWHASINLQVAAVGARFDVKTEFDLATPAAAIDQLIERMLAALAMAGSAGTR